MAPLEVWHLQDSRSFRVIWLLEELNIPYSLVYAKRENFKAPANFKSKHGMGKAPMLVLDDEKKTTLIESQAICDYLLNAVATPEQKKQYFGNGGEIEAAIVKGWAAWAEATLMTHAIPIVYAGWFMPEAHKDALPELQEKMSINVRNDLNYLENTLKENTKSGYIFGNDITFADIMVAFSAHYVLALEKGAKWNDDTYPHVKDWIRRLRKREGWQRAVSKGEDSYTFDANTP